MSAVLCEISAETSGNPHYVIIIFVVAGAAVALFCTMHTKEQLGGCIALSTMLPEKLPGFPDPSSIVNKGQDSSFSPHHITCLTADIPYFQAHGESDNILPLSHGIATSKNLKKFLPNHQVKQASQKSTLGKKVKDLTSSFYFQFKTYYCQHECTDRELADVKEFIENIVGH